MDVYCNRCEQLYPETERVKHRTCNPPVKVVTRSHPVEPKPVVTKAVTNPVTKCNHCAEKDDEIEWLRNQLILAEDQRDALKKLNGIKLKPKRDRAAYMKEYRKK